jgi:hypothetical protein
MSLTTMLLADAVSKGGPGSGPHGGGAMEHDNKACVLRASLKEK